MGRSRYKILYEDYPYFITSSIVEGYPLFNSADIKTIILNGLQFLIEKRSIRMYAYVIMPNHIHFIIEGENLGKHIPSFKSYTARRIIDYLKNEKLIQELNFLRNAKLAFKTDREFQVWTEGFHPKQIMNDEIMIQKMEYIHYNPVKADLVKRLEDWEYSSAGFYMGAECELGITRFGDWGAPTQSIGAR